MPVMRQAFAAKDSRSPSRRFQRSRAGHPEGARAGKDLPCTPPSCTDEAWDHGRALNVGFLTKEGARLLKARKPEASVDQRKRKTSDPKETVESHRKLECQHPTERNAHIKFLHNSFQDTSY